MVNNLVNHMVIPLQRTLRNRDYRLCNFLYWCVGVRSQLKQKNIDNVSKAEEQAAQQNYEACIYLLLVIIIVPLL